MEFVTIYEYGIFITKFFKLKIQGFKLTKSLSYKSGHGRRLSFLLFQKGTREIVLHSQI